MVFADDLEDARLVVKEMEHHGAGVGQLVNQQLTSLDVTLKGKRTDENEAARTWMGG